jgi:molybdate transport system substrate-binding protein
MARFKLAPHALALGLLLALLVHSPRQARAENKPPKRTLQVFAAASLTDAFTEIGRSFERRNPGITIRFNFAGSQLLATQIEQGALADVFASADDRWMGYVRERGLLLGETVTFARNQLIVIVPKSNPAHIQRLQDLARGGVKIVLGADVVPVGHYSRAVLHNLSRDPAFDSEFGGNVLRNVVSEEENVKSVVGKVQLGEADAGIVYRSDVLHGVARFVRVFEIPASANVTTSYPVSLVKDSREAEAGRAFVALVLSPEGQAILERNGLLRAAASQP